MCDVDMDGKVKEGSCGVGFDEDGKTPVGGADREGIILARVFEGEEAGMEGNDNGRGWVYVEENGTEIGGKEMDGYVDEDDEKRPELFFEASSS